MTVNELITLLDLLPADAQVVLSTKHDGDTEDFTVEMADDGTVVLEAD